MKTIITKHVRVCWKSWVRKDMYHVTWRKKFSNSHFFSHFSKEMLVGSVEKVRLIITTHAKSYIIVFKGIYHDDWLLRQLVYYIKSHILWYETKIIWHAKFTLARNHIVQKKKIRHKVFYFKCIEQHVILNIMIVHTKFLVIIVTRHFTKIHA